MGKSERRTQIAEREEDAEAGVKPNSHFLREMKKGPMNQRPPVMTRDKSSLLWNFIKRKCSPSSIPLIFP